MKFFPRRKGLFLLLCRKCIPTVILVGLLLGFINGQSVLWPGGLGFDGVKIDSDSLISKEPKGDEIIETDRMISSGKTLWDWLSLLGVPLSLALLAAWLQSSQKQQAAVDTKEQRERDENRLREEALQAYYDRISVILIDKNLLGTTYVDLKDDPSKRQLVQAATDVIRARTLSILRRFSGDSERKSSVIQFLVDTETISSLSLSLKGADLSGVDLSDVDLSGVDLSSANLTEADLTKANFTRANLSRTNFSAAKLINTIFTRTNLTYAKLDAANAQGADFTAADLSDASLVRSDLRGANFRKTNLSQVTLTFSDLTDIKADKNTIWPARENIIEAKIRRKVSENS